MNRASAAAPIAFATGFAALMLWLAGGPFDPRPRAVDARALVALPLVEPSGELSRFPRTFAWDAFPGADEYEVAVANADAGQALFRQRGATTQLDLQVDPALEPPAGKYVWEVVALDEGVAVARGTGAFVVRAVQRSP